MDITTKSRYDGGDTIDGLDASSNIANPNSSISLFNMSMADRSTTRLSRPPDSYVTSMESLHHNFVMSVQPMSSRYKVFDVITEWMSHLEKTLHLGKASDSDIPDDVFRRVQEILRKEHETWNLIRILYYDRLNISEEDSNEEFKGTIRDMYHINELTYVNLTLENDKLHKEMGLILSWLETNYGKKGEPDVTNKFINWEQTLEALKRDKLLERTTSKTMVKHMDPDAPIREKKQLHPLDGEEELKVQKGAFYYLRTGSHRKAVAFLHESGHFARASTLLGMLFTYKEPLQSDDNFSQQVSIPSVTPQLPQMLPPSEFPPKSKRQARSKPNFSIEGNLTRDLWKCIALQICESNGQPKYERACLGAVCGHRQSMLDASQGWEDKLWSYLKASFDVKIEEKLRSHSEPNNYIDLPEDYWAQGLSVAECFERLDPGDHEHTVTPEYIFRHVQKCVMIDNIELLLNTLCLNILELLQSGDHPIIIGHFVRFLTHVLLSFGIVGLPFDEQLMNTCSEAYIKVLVKAQQLVYIPFYVQKLSESRQITVISEQIDTSISLDRDEIELFLKSAHANDLDVLKIGVAIVEKLREEQEDFNVENFLWITCCYGFVRDTNQVMLAFVRYTLLISRKYLTLGDEPKVKKMIKEITSDCISEVANISEEYNDTLIREFVCYREYLEAEDAFMMWKRAKGQKPIWDELPLDNSSTLADKALWNKRKRDFEALEAKWFKVFEHHTKMAIRKYMEILKFPDGWLNNCYDPAEEDDVLHISAVRRIIIKKVTYVLLKLLQEKKSARLLRDFVSVICEDHRKILNEFASHEIGTIFKAVEEFTQKKSKNLITLPK